MSCCESSLHCLLCQSWYRFDSSLFRHFATLQTALNIGKDISHFPFQKFAMVFFYQMSEFKVDLIHAPLFRHLMMRPRIAASLFQKKLQQSFSCQWTTHSLISRFRNCVETLTFIFTSLQICTCYKSSLQRD